MTADAPAPDDPALQALRGRIDALDGELLVLLSRRAALALEVGALKHARGTPVFRPQREAQVVARLQQANPGPLPAAAIAAVWREVMSACRGLESAPRVAFLGPAGTFSEQAALEHFGAAIERLPCESIDEVFRATAAGAADFGVVPLENSTEGVVARSLDLLLNTPLAIVGETSLAVRHNLLRAAAGLDGVQAVLAHPQALAQCHAWLSTKLPRAERRPVASNAEGARQAAADAALTALASDRAAGEYGLHVVAAAVQDDAHNRTRFGIVAQPLKQPAPGPTGRDRTSLVVSVDNRPGAMHDMLVPLKVHGVSMSRLESRPARSGQWEYHFYIDLQGHREDPPVAAALQGLRAVCTFFKVLGSYPLDAT